MIRNGFFSEAQFYFKTNKYIKFDFLCNWSIGNRLNFLSKATCHFHVWINVLTRWIQDMCKVVGFLDSHNLFFYFILFIYLFIFWCDINWLESVTAEFYYHVVDIKSIEMIMPKPQNGSYNVFVYFLFNVLLHSWAHYNLFCNTLVSKFVVIIVYIFNS